MITLPHGMHGMEECHPMLTSSFVYSSPLYYTQSHMLLPIATADVTDSYTQ